MNLQPTLENELLILRPLKESDFELLYEIAKDPLIWEQHPSFDRYQKAVYSVFFKNAIASKGALIVIEKSTQKIIGSTRFEPIQGTKNAIEIGWSFLSRDYWGRSFNKSMKTLMINHAFETITDVILYVDQDNIRSQKAVRKIGGVRITEAKYKHLLNTSETEWTYRIDKESWQK